MPGSAAHSAATGRAEGNKATEYGSSKDTAAFRYLRAYSPLHNVKPGVCYPATLQKAQSAVPGCEKPVLLRVEAQGSHGYRPLDRRIAEFADIWSFAAYHLGMTVRQQTNVVQ